MARFFQSHRLALAVLLAVWLLFFWRVWSPYESLSFAEGDFSGQFVAWTDYAVERLAAGELPLWNPYYYGGAPFQADPQTALTYPPRILTLASLLIQADVTPQEVYAALQREVMLHVLAVSVFLYLFTARLIAETKDTSPAAIRFGGLVAALSFSYGGYFAGYPILQAPLLESAIWLPLILLGILHAFPLPEMEDNGRALARPYKRWGFVPGGVIFSGVMLAFCLLAGHPQTALFSIYMALAFMAWRVSLGGLTWREGARRWFIGVLMLGAVAGSLAAVQLLPTAELSTQTVRVGLTFEAKGGGYSFEELSNVLFPVRGHIWVASYFGILTMLLGLLAIVRRVHGAAVFGALFVLAGLLSFGARLPIYGILYPLLPGMTLFRGQERATFILAYALAILAGLGAACLLRWQPSESEGRRARRVMWVLLAICAGYASFNYLIGQTELRTEAMIARMDGAIVSAALLGTLLMGWGWFRENPLAAGRQAAVIGVVLFDLFSANFMLRQNYEPIPVSERLSTPDFVAVWRESLPLGGRGDGGRGIYPGYSTVYRLPDIQGSNPLQLDAMRFYLEDVPRERRWEVLAVAGVHSEESGLPVPASALGTAYDAGGAFNLWRLDNPRPFAHLAYQVSIAASEEDARQRVFTTPDLRETVILESDPGILTTPDPDSGIQWTTYAPEYLTLNVQSETPAVLSLALPYYPGWRVSIDGQPADLLRAYGGLSAVYLPAGEHAVTLEYRPRWLIPAALVSLVGWLAVLLAGLAGVFSIDGQYWNWWGFSTRYSVGVAVNRLVGYLLAALVMLTVAL